MKEELDFSGRQTVEDLNFFQEDMNLLEDLDFSGRTELVEDVDF